MRSAYMPVIVYMSGAEKAWFYERVNHYYRVTLGEGSDLDGPLNLMTLSASTYGMWLQRFDDVRGK